MSNEFDEDKSKFDVEKFKVDPDSDCVHDPKHYIGRDGLEVSDVLKNFLTDEELEGWYKGNVIKYILRYPHKGGLVDLNKCGVYLNWLKTLIISREQQA